MNKISKIISLLILTLICTSLVIPTKILSREREFKTTFTFSDGFKNAHLGNYGSYKIILYAKNGAEYTVLISVDKQGKVSFNEIRKKLTIMDLTLISNSYKPSDSYKYELSTYRDCIRNATIRADPDYGPFKRQYNMISIKNACKDHTFEIKLFDKGAVKPEGTLCIDGN